MLRIHFTAEDLGRVRLALEPDALWETVLSLHQLVCPDPYFAPWCRRTRAWLSAAGLGPDTGMLAALAPPSSYFPDFLTPVTTSTTGSTFQEGVDTVLSTSRKRLSTDISRLAAGRSGRSVWLDDIGSGRPDAIRRLGSALHRYHDVALAPYTDTSADCAQRDRVRRVRHTLEHGSEDMLAHLSPTTRWRAPILEVDYPVTQELHLEGRGLTIIPSFFCHNHPITLALPELPPVLVYPVARGPLWIPEPATRAYAGSALDELLGATRAAVLRRLDTPHSATTLALRLHVSAATVSRHATALRAAGLIRTERQRARVQHSRTALGTALLYGNRADDARS